MRVITRGRLVAAVLGLSASVASAQGPPAMLYGPVAGCPFGNCAAANHGTYGPALFAANPKGHAKLPSPSEPSCIGRSSYPLTDWHYIRQFCGPTFVPGSCYGYHPTKWRKWEETCASVGGCGTVAAPEVMAPGPLVVTPSAPPPALPMPVPPSSEILPPPKADVPKVDPVTPPKVPLVPPPAEPGKEPGKISTTDASVPMPMPQVVPPMPEPRVVVPPMLK